MADEETFDVDEDLHNLEDRIKILRAEYNQYFGGSRRELPRFTEMMIRRLIKRYAGSTDLRGHQRFLYYDLVARYNTMREYWNRRLRTREEGIRIGAPAHLKVEHKRPAADTLKVLRQAPRQLREPRTQEREVRTLYLDFVRAIRQYQGEEGFLSFPKFQRLIETQTSQIKDRRQCEAVEFRVEIGDDGRVRLKAKPVREAPAT
jgi:hypothetical protein